MYSAAGDHAVAVLQVVDHFLLLFLPPLIWQEQEKIEDREDSNQWYQADYR